MPFVTLGERNTAMTRNPIPAGAVLLMAIIVALGIIAYVGGVAGA
jgi:hypothetical protein